MRACEAVGRAGQAGGTRLGRRREVCGSPARASQQRCSHASEALRARPRAACQQATAPEAVCDGEDRGHGADFGHADGQGRVGDLRNGGPGADVASMRRAPSPLPGSLGSAMWGKGLLPLVLNVLHSAPSSHPGKASDAACAAGSRPVQQHHEAPPIRATLPAAVPDAAPAAAPTMTGAVYVSELRVR